MANVVSDLREMLREQVEYRELLARMVGRDLLIRYKQAVMGIGWAVFMPLLNTAVFSVIFARVARIDTPVAYPLFAFCGLWAWNFFASSLRFGVVSLTSNPNLVSKVYFPREIFPFAAVIVSLVDFAVAAVVLVGLMIYYQVFPGWTILFFPVVLIVHVTFTTAIALILSMANLFYRDVKYLFELVLSLWMFVTSVLYPLDAVDGKLAILIKLNPMTPIIDGYRSTLLGLPISDPRLFAATAVLSVVLLVGAWLAFHRAEFQFAENL